MSAHDMLDPDSDEQMQKIGEMASHISMLFSSFDAHPTTALRSLAVCAASIIAVQSGSAANMEVNKKIFHETFEDYITPIEDGGCLVSVSDDETIH